MSPRKKMNLQSVCATIMMVTGAVTALVGSVKTVGDLVGCSPPIQQMNVPVMSHGAVYLRTVIVLLGLTIMVVAWQLKKTSRREKL